MADYGSSVRGRLGDILGAAIRKAEVDTEQESTEIKNSET